MRSIRTKDFHLIHNLNFKMPFPIDQDFFVAPAFQDVLNRTQSGRELNWHKSLDQYYYRPEWELFRLSDDPNEVINLAKNVSFSTVLTNLQDRLNAWQNITADPWICAPWGVLEYQGVFKGKPQCLPLYNGLSKSEIINISDTSLPSTESSVLLNYRVHYDAHENSFQTDKYILIEMNQQFYTFILIFAVVLLLHFIIIFKLGKQFKWHHR